MAIEEDPPAGVPEWVVTYGDMMSLLLTFFIMLVSMSKIKEEGTMRAMLDSLQERFGPTMGAFGVPGISKQSTSAYIAPGSTGRKMEGGLKKGNHPSPGRGGPNKQVRNIQKGTLITLGGPVMFEPFSAELTPALKADLDVIIEIVREKSNMIEVKGHASSEPLPPDSVYRDPMDLSFQRAIRVTEYLINHRGNPDASGIAPERIITTAAGASEPRQITRNSGEQLQNHRVDVFILESYITQRNVRPQADSSDNNLP
ncbi:MAG: flagellar motor protein MotB [Planctomycetales bacterium]